MPVQFQDRIGIAEMHMIEGEKMGDSVVHVREHPSEISGPVVVPSDRE